VSALLDIRNLSVQFQTAKGPLHAVTDISLAIARGETVGLVGESGSGKSTLARAVLQLLPASGGRVIFDGREVHKLSAVELRAVRRRMQPVFQDPTASLDPRLTIGATLAEAFLAAGITSASEQKAKVGPLLESLGLSPELEARLPRELSSGQRQRVCIGRALAVGPELLVLDEPVSALDVSVQAQILELLAKLRVDRGLTYLFISHDLGVVSQLCSRVAVMNLGRIVEEGPVAEVLDAPRHPYTRALLASLPARTPKERVDRPLPKGEPPSPLAPPPGCPFHPRCPNAQARCRVEVPRLEGDTRRAACFFPG
jgi:oligopeptide/dipeptide ABC transporter ATP-binding protein